MRALTPVARRALELLGRHASGLDEQPLMDGHGVSRQLLAGLVRRGLVEVRREMGANAASPMADDKPIQASKVLITRAGRRALKS